MRIRALLKRSSEVLTISRSADLPRSRPYALCKMARKHVTVRSPATGGDEVFGGLQTLQEARQSTRAAPPRPRRAGRGWRPRLYPSPRAIALRNARMYFASSRPAIRMDMTIRSMSAEEGRLNRCMQARTRGGRKSPTSMTRAPARPSSKRPNGWTLVISSGRQIPGEGESLRAWPWTRRSALPLYASPVHRSGRQVFFPKI